MKPTEILCIEFAFRKDTFYAVINSEPGPEYIERVDSQVLRRAFLPKMTPEGRQLIRQTHFVLGQLKHYGVAFDEKDLLHPGTQLLKKALKEGKCDNVPVKIEKLRKQMRADWYDRLSQQELGDDPDLVLQKYFLNDSGRIDKEKTKSVVSVNFPHNSNYKARKLREAVEDVRGLYYATGWSDVQTIYMGWGEAAVKKAARNQEREAQYKREATEPPRKKARTAEDEHADKRMAQINVLHQAYLDKTSSKTGSAKVINAVGSYVVHCPEILRDFPEDSRNLFTLDIRRTRQPGVLEASFNFGILEGTMIMSAYKEALAEYRSKHDDTEYPSDSEDAESEELEDYEWDEEEELNPTPKEPKTKSQKKWAKALNRPKRELVLEWRGREMGECQIYPEPERGEVLFEGPSFASFAGSVNMSLVGRGVKFQACKVSDTPQPADFTWFSFSDASYENGRTRRWG